MFMIGAILFDLQILIIDEDEAFGDGQWSIADSQWPGVISIATDAHSLPVIS